MARGGSTLIRSGKVRNRWATREPIGRRKMLGIAGRTALAAAVASRRWPGWTATRVLAAGPTLQLWDAFNPLTSDTGKAETQLWANYQKASVDHSFSPYADLYSKVIVAGQARTGPDMLHMLGEWVPGFVQAGYIRDLTDKVNAWPDKHFFPDKTWKVATYNGRIYGIPETASTRVLIYRSDLTAAAEIHQPPRTWDDLVTIGKKLANPEKNVYGFGFCSATTEPRGAQEFAIMLWSTGGDFARRAGSVWEVAFTREQAEMVFGFYDRLWKEKVMPPYGRAWDSKQLDSGFATGTLAMAQEGAWMRNYTIPGRGVLASPEAKPAQWRVAPFPYAKQPATFLEVKVNGVGAFSTHPDEAWDLLTFLSSAGAMTQMNSLNNLPPRTDVLSRPEYTTNPWMPTFIQNTKFGVTFPAIVMQPVGVQEMTFVQDVLFGRKTPKQAALAFYDYMGTYLKTQK